jgi:tyrosine-protein kinase Etk/Wzc
VKKNNNIFNNSALYFFLFKYRLQFLIVISISILGSSIASFFIQDKFKSTAIIYPSSTTSTTSLFNENSKNIVEFGDEEKTEQLLEILNSEKIREHLTKKFDLINYYKIKSNTPQNELNEIFKENFSFRKNKNMALEITVFDHQADTAALMTNEVLVILDDVINSIRKKRAQQGLKIVENAYLKLKNEIVDLEDSLHRLMSKGIIDIPSQSEAFNTTYAEAILLNNKNAMEELKKNIDNLSNNGGAFVILRDRIMLEMNRLSILKTKYEEAKVGAEEKIDNFFIVTHPYPAKKKSYPIRWLIVSISTLCTTVLAYLILIIYDQSIKVRAENPEL